MSFSSTRSERGHKSYFASVSLIILFCFILVAFWCLLVGLPVSLSVSFPIPPIGRLYFPLWSCPNIAHYNCHVMEGLVVDCGIRLSKHATLKRQNIGAEGFPASSCSVYQVWKVKAYNSLWITVR